MKRIAVVPLLVAAAVAAGAGAADATVQPGSPLAHHVLFIVQDTAGALITRQPLTKGQVIFSGGVAHRVGLVHGSEITLIPALPKSDWGKAVVFST